MRIGEQTVEIPNEVREAVGDALSAGELMAWWDRPHPLLLNSTPHRMWDKGKKNDVFAFIESAKSGDMA